MGLREKKAARTRAQIIGCALALFVEQGYEATTMEQIAEAAEVGTTTLYRYFPSKDLILLDPFTRADVLPAALRARPADEPLETALREAIVSALEDFTADQPDINLVRTLIDRSPGPRARLWDFIAQDVSRFAQAIADRTGEPADSPTVRMTARTALLVIELAADTWRSAADQSSLAEVARKLLAELDDRPPVLPWGPEPAQGRIESTYPPSTRSAPPVVAEASGDAR